MSHHHTPIIVTIDPEFQTIRRRAALNGLVDLLDQLPDGSQIPSQGIAALIALSITPSDAELLDND